MANPAPSVKPITAPPPPLAPLAGFLSLLIPGLGQMIQGRVGKGLLFFVCIYTLFFYGMIMGSGRVMVDGHTYTVPSNVYIPDTFERDRRLPGHEFMHGNVRAVNDRNPYNLPELLVDLYNRPQYVGQFWVGVVAWPALWQYFHPDREQEVARADREPVKQLRLFGQFQRTPSEEAINALQNSGDKRLDLAWIYTVIAGVLNIMVIYDALAGPAFLLPRTTPPVQEAIA
jgi:hypothetical protein